MYVFSNISLNMQSNIYFNVVNKHCWNHYFYISASKDREPDSVKEFNKVRPSKVFIYFGNVNVGKNVMASINIIIYLLWIETLLTVT